MEELRKEIVSRIRSCLISTKGQVTLRQLEDDYRTLLGERIPYQKLGFKNLESFIQSVPTLMTSRGAGGETLVDAQVSEKSAHISSMVQKQKSAGTKKRVRIAPPHHTPRFGYRTNGSQPPPPAMPKWRPKKNAYASAAKRTYEQPSRLAAVSHNQFVSGGGYKKPKVPSKVVVPERSEFNQKKMSPPKEQKVYQPSEKAMDNGTTNGDDCSPLSSTMKRISKIMNEISMERDSGNSSPTTEYAASLKLHQEFVKTGDPIADIRSFAAYHKLGEVEVKFTETKSKKSKIAQCHCKITVGQHKYSSYPDDFFDREAAERHAAQKALDDLSPKYNRRRSLLLSSNDDIIERIPPMLEKHSSAVWMWQIEADYIDKYSEQLPPDWLQVIDNSPHVFIEKCLGGYVLKHCNPDDKGKKMDISLNEYDVSVPCNTTTFPENNRLYAVVTAAISTNEVWCQEVGTGEYEKFVEMTDKMEKFYGQHHAEMVATNINFGTCYIIYHDGGWIRVRALSVLQEGTVHCFLIDYGVEIDVARDNIHLMKREFALVQAQAFVCRLDGLEDLNEVSLESEQMADLVGKEYVLEIVEDERRDGDIVIPIVMYDVNTGASVNEDLISTFAIQSAEPVLDKTGITEVFVSNIEPNGDVYVQVRTFGYHRLADALKDLSESVTKAPPLHLLAPPTKNTDPKKMFLVKCSVTQKWARAVVIDWAPKGDLAQIYFVDHGIAQVVNVATERMFPLEKLDDVIYQFPPQALKVRIMLEKIPADFVLRAERLLSREQPVLLKISSFDNEDVAWVEFFKRTNDGVLVFINKSISVEAELQHFDYSGSNNNETTRKRLINLVQFSDASKTVPSGGSLKKPDLPKTGDYFNVNIPFAVNPWNFFVQPLDTFHQLTAMMSDMQEYYKDIEFSPLPIDDIVPGKIYASKHEDGLWYRTSVLKVIHSGSISVFYCDFGYYTNLTLAQLVALDAKYMSFPYQALKAKIAGIKPIKNKWTMEDCNVFNSLVTKKQFVSVLVNIEKDELYKSDIILQLLLIDTSSDEDVQIKDVLIEKGIATSV